MLQWMDPYLPDIWLGLMGFFLLYYAVTDGLDLGVGIISLFSRSREDRRTLMGSIRSNWHGNQTWLVILGGMLFGAFPLFYGVILSALYIPILIMLFGLIFRGVGFEFLEYSDNKRLWGLSFSIGSLVAALAQGLALGGVLSGSLAIENGRFTGHPFDFLNLYSVLVAAGVLFGYVMLGANYLIMKTEGNIQRLAYRIATATSLVTLAIALDVHIWTMVRFPYVAEKLASFPDGVIAAGFALLALASFGMLFRSILKRFELAPLVWNTLIVLFSFIALSIGFYPYMIPLKDARSVLVGEAAASPSTLWFMLVMAAIVLPVILVYTTYEFWVFRGKTEKGYH